MHLSHRKIRSWFYLGILPVLLLGFSTHSLKPNGKLLHTRMPHRTFRMASRTGEACAVDHVDGDCQQAAVVSLPSAHERPKDPVRILVVLTMPVAAPVVFADRYGQLLARSDLDEPLASPAIDLRSARGPPALS